ncbi:MAG TPA: efflux RND transporter periplasmic adaptor subunit [Verrucomicrobiae bacterium]|nr:efflux RND transporter periplasmic adaptor subunit [Verrucomicrobiae bacterium]
MRIPIAIALAAAGLAPALAENEIQTEVAVQVAKVQRATLRSYVIAYGVVEGEPARSGRPGAAARLAPPVTGLVTEVLCSEGQRAEKGATLFRLDSRVVEVAVAAANVNLDRQRQLMKVEGTSQKALQEAEQQMAAAEAQLALLRIEAPFSGTVTRVNVRPGEAVDPGKVLGELVDMDRLVVTCSVPAAEATAVAAGQSAEIGIAGHTPISGSVLWVTPGVDPQAGTVPVRVGMPAGAGLQPGQFARVRIVTGQREGVLAVPRESVYTDHDGQSTVSLVEGDVAKRRAVKVGFRDGDLVEVAGEGIAEGATVVTLGSYALPKETRVRVGGR